MASDAPSLPYYNIDPDRALAMPDDPTATADFDATSGACQVRGNDLISRELEEACARKLRCFSIWEITCYLIPVASGHFRRALRQNPGLPQGIYDADYRDFNRKTYVRGRQTFDETYAAFKQLLIGGWHGDELVDEVSE